jgi:hypothetical protein
MVVSEWFRMQESSFYHKKIFKLMLMRDKWISVLVDCVEK